MNAMDASYVRHCSPWLDLKIMLQTPGVLLRQVFSVLRKSEYGGEMNAGAPE
jgi:lipopolysaccharide/colanic/teichoic acid biosynthesis glycosyltransferase